MTRLMFTPEEVAEALACSKASVYAAIHRGDLPAVQLGRLLRIPVSGLEKWIETGSGTRESLAR